MIRRLALALLLLAASAAGGDAFARVAPAEQARAAIHAMVAAHPDGAAATVLAIHLPAGRLDAAAKEIVALPPQGGLRSGAVVVMLAVTAPDGIERRIPVTVEMALALPVLVATRDVARGERLSAADVRVETRGAATRGRWLDAPAQVEGQVARATLRAGRPIPASAVGSVQAVEPGQKVTAFLRQGTVTLALDTTARGRGGIGAIVPITGIDGHRLVRARVVAPGRVVVLGSDALEVPAPEPPPVQEANRS